MKERLGLRRCLFVQNEPMLFMSDPFQVALHQMTVNFKVILEGGTLVAIDPEKRPTRLISSPMSSMVSFFSSEGSCSGRGTRSSYAWDDSDQQNVSLNRRIRLTSRWFSKMSART